MVAYPKLFEPITIGKIVIKNRIAMAPMGTLGLNNPDGNPGQRAIDYYIERARGGVGLIITGIFMVSDEIEDHSRMHMVNQGSQGPFGELSEAVHALGVKIFVQLTPGFGRVAPLRIARGHPVSASAVPHLSEPGLTCRPLEIGEVERIVVAFGDAAGILASAGVDGIELHGHEGYLLDQFTTSIWNQRTDKYGGDLKGRLSFPIELLQIIKERAGADFPVQYRFGLKHYMKGNNSGALPGESFIEVGRDIEEGLEMARLLEAAGFDSLHVDAGCYDSWYWAHPPIYQEHGCMVDMAARVKGVVKVPVIAAGRLEVPELAEKVIATGKADMVALGRGLLADPDWPVKVAEGKVDDIRPCIACHDGCIWRFMQGKPLSCAVNPTCGRERLYGLHCTEKPKRVMVVGGGMAGMEAARAAATRGHKVILYEKGKALGGHVIAGSAPEFKKDLVTLLNWYKNQLQNLSVDVKLDTEVSAGIIEKESPDVVIVATGSRHLVPDISGLNKGKVLTCSDVLLGRSKVGQEVVVIGGGMVGCETALWLSKKGKGVTIVEILPELMLSQPPLPQMNRQMLTGLLTLNKVTIFTGVRVQEITKEGVTITGENLARALIKADTVVLAAGLESNNKLFQELQGRVAHLYAIGDCLEPRNIMGAIWDGYEVGRAV